MRLARVEIEGYRSIKSALTVHIDRRITILLGANDHGKSNVLNALVHLNADARFDESIDLNWDCQDKKDTLPRVLFEFELSDDERSEIAEAENLERQDSFIEELVEKSETDYR